MLTERSTLVDDFSVKSPIFENFQITTAPAAIEPFGAEKLNEDPRQKELLQSAMSLLQSFRKKELPFCDVFDCEIYAKYFALQYVFGAEHGNAWNNERFYYNPINSLIEPVSFDNLAGEISRHTLSGLNEAPVLINFAFLDERFPPLYQKELERVSKKEFIDSIFNEYKDQLDRYQGFLWRDYSYFNYKDLKETLYFNAAEIRSIIDAKKPIHARFDFNKISENKTQLVVQVRNFLPLGISIPYVNVDGKNFDASTFKNCSDGQGISKFVLNPVLFHRFTDYQSFCLEIPQDNIGNVEVEASVLGTNISNKLDAIWLKPKFPEERITERDANLAAFPFIEVDQVSKIIKIKTGVWEIAHNLIVPNGFTFVAEPGAQIKVAEGVSIFSYSPISFVGEENAHISISSLDPEKPWGSFVVMMNDETSHMRFVEFSGASEHMDQSFSISGGLTFFKSNVDLQNVNISNMHGEDGLNIVLSEFLIKNSSIVNTFSDGFDSDFSKGKVVSSSFINIGNDAIDVSGTTVEIEDLTVDTAGDKGVSAGEKSFVTVSNSTVKNSFIGMGSKDLSKLEANNVDLFNTKFSLAAYQKKPEFGPAVINLTTKQTIPEETVLLHEKSSIVVNSKSYKFNRKKDHDVFAELEEMMGNK